MYITLIPGAGLCPVINIPTGTVSTNPPSTRPVSETFTNSGIDISSVSSNSPTTKPLLDIYTKSFTDSNENPPVITSTTSTSVGAIIGGTVSVILLTVVFLPLLLIVCLFNKKKAGSTQHIGRGPSQQIYTQQNISYRSSQHHVHTQNNSNVYSATPVSQSQANWTSNKVEALAPHTGDLTDSAPPAYDEALNYPVPPKDPPPYPTT